MGGRRGRGGRLFEAGRLINFSAFRMCAYSRWALIRGWALIRIILIKPIIVFARVYTSHSNKFPLSQTVGSRAVGGFSIEDGYGSVNVTFKMN